MLAIASRVRLRARSSLAAAVARARAAVATTTKPAAADDQDDRATTTTTTAAPVIAPLTGLPDPTGESPSRPAVTVKIDNTRTRPPQYGIDQADVVYEEVVEGGITRLAAIFNSHAPDRVGPVRSVRKTDQSIVWPIGGIFAYSGGAPISRSTASTPRRSMQLDETRAGDADVPRLTRASAPYNLYAHVDQHVREGAANPCRRRRCSRTARRRRTGRRRRRRRVVRRRLPRPASRSTWTWDAAERHVDALASSASPTVDAARRADRAAERRRACSCTTSAASRRAALEGAEAELTGPATLSVFTGGQDDQGHVVAPRQGEAREAPRRRRATRSGSRPGRRGSSSPDVVLHRDRHDRRPPTSAAAAPSDRRRSPRRRARR